MLAVGGEHRLMSGRADIDDRQAAEAEGDAGGRVAPRAAVIRPAMQQGVRHATGNLTQRRIGTAR
jgi:hypothetical protein